MGTTPERYTLVPVKLSESSRREKVVDDTLKFHELFFLLLLFLLLLLKLLGVEKSMYRFEILCCGTGVGKHIIHITVLYV